MLAAVINGNVKKLAELIRQDPDFDVNLAVDGHGWTLLHHACDEDNGYAVIPILLAHPDIDVNAKNINETPFYYACCGRPSCVREMLKDSRVKVNEPNRDGETPLWVAANYGFLDVIKWWVASGREMNLGKPDDKTDAIGLAKDRGKTEVVSLLERFKEHPEETRHAMRVELGFLDELAAEMFAMMVFVSDGLLQFKATGVKAGAKRTRFFNIACQLPLELQMVLCFRQVGSSKEIIQGKDTERAFKSMTKSLLWSSYFTG